nr:MAG TPA: hypothetical protein [Caudoviricetes sp.]
MLEQCWNTKNGSTAISRAYCSSVPDVLAKMVVRT